MAAVDTGAVGEVIGRRFAEASGLTECNPDFAGLKTIEIACAKTLIC